VRFFVTRFTVQGGVIAAPAGTGGESPLAAGDGRPARKQSSSPAPTKSLRALADDHGLNLADGAWITSDPAEGDNQRRRGFRAGGHLLLAQAAESPLTQHLIYPALMVYRHYYELQLKELLRLGRRVLRQPQQANHHHGLMELYEQVREAMLVIWPGETDELEPLTAAVTFLSQADPTSQTFRYATLTKGAPSIAQPTFLHPLPLAELLEAGANLLEGSETGMDEWIRADDEHRAYKQDLDAEMYRDLWQ
jgi:hypothetical protein